MGYDTGEYGRGAVNTGMIEAVNGGRMRILGGGDMYDPEFLDAGQLTLDNTGGTVRASGWGESLMDGYAPARVSFRGFNVVQGGDFIAEDGGELVFMDRMHLHDATVSAVNGGAIYSYDPIYSEGHLIDASFQNVTFNVDGLSRLALHTNNEFNGTVLKDVSFELEEGARAHLVDGVFFAAGTLTVSGGTLNLGSINDIDIGDTLGELWVREQVTLSGGGTLRLNSYGFDASAYDASRIAGDNNFNENRLTNMDVTITGTGMLGAPEFEHYGSTMGITNFGTIRAEEYGELAWVMGYYGFEAVNAGLIEAVNGGRVRILGGGDFYDPDYGFDLTLDNTGGIVRASGMGESLQDGFAPARVSFQGFSGIQGGEFIAEEGGELLFMEQTHLYDATVSAVNGGAIYGFDFMDPMFRLMDASFQNVTFNVDGMSRVELRTGMDIFEGTVLKDVVFQLEQDSRAHLAEGAFTVAGTLTVSGGTLDIGSFNDPEINDSMADLLVREQVTLSGGGTLRLNSMDANYDMSRITGNWDYPDSRLTNMDVTITGTGLLGADNMDDYYYGGGNVLGITNYATIRAEEYGELAWVMGYDTNEFGRGAVNTGMIEAVHGGRVRIVGGGDYYDSEYLDPWQLTLDNTGGTVRASGFGESLMDGYAPARVRFEGVNIVQGGDFIAEDGGELVFLDRMHLHDATVSAVNGSAIYGMDFMDPMFRLMDASFQNVTFNVDGMSRVELRTGMDYYEGTVLRDVVFQLEQDSRAHLAEGTFTVAGTLTVSGGTLNIGSFNDPEINDSMADLLVREQVTLNGGGTLRLNSMDANYDMSRITGNWDYPDSRLTNEDVTITGTGLLGADNMDDYYYGGGNVLGITNHGTIRAEEFGELAWVMGYDTGEFGRGTVNDNLIEAVNGGRVRILGGGDYYYPEFLDAGQLTLDNTGGTVRASGFGESLMDGYAPARVRFEGVNIVQGGDFIAEDGGELVFLDRMHLHDATVSAVNGSAVYGFDFMDPMFRLMDASFQNVTFNVDGMSRVELRTGMDIFEGTVLKDVVFQLEQDSRAHLAEGAFTVAGTLTVSGGTLNIGSMGDPEVMDGRADLRVREQVTLNGGGTLRLNSWDPYLDMSRITGDTDWGYENRLTNEDVTITGTGLLGGDNMDDLQYGGVTLGITNHGTIRAEEYGELAWVMGYDTGEFGRGTVNDNLIEAVNGGRVRILGGGDYYYPEFLYDGQLTLDNTGGTVRASGMGESLMDGYAPARVSFQGFNVVQGGDFIAEDGGELVFLDQMHLHDATVSAVNGSAIYGTDFEDLTYGLMDASFQNVTFNVDGMSRVELRTGYGNSEGTVLRDVSFQLEQDSRAHLAEGTFAVAGTLTVSGGTLNIGSWGDMEIMDGFADLLVREQVALTGGGTLRLNGALRLNSPDFSANVSRIIGHPDYTGNQLTIANATITGTGILGASDFGEPASVQILNHGTIRADAGDTLVVVTDTASPLVNSGLLDVKVGGVIAITGPMTQTALGAVQTEMNGSVAGTDYSVLEIQGAATLDGAFRLNIGAGYTPTNGDVFLPVTWGGHTGEFRSYNGLRKDNVVLRPVYTAGALELHAETLGSGTSAPAQPVVDGSTVSIPAGEPLAGLTSNSVLPGGNGTVATILSGTASGSTNVTFSFSPAGNFSAGLGGDIVSDILTLTGTDGMMFVLQFDYNEALAVGAFGLEESLYVSWFNPLSSQWVNSVYGNSDNGLAIHGFIGAYDENTQFQLGNYGVDTVANRVWAVIDHNSEFAAGGLQVVPEPASATLLLGGLAACLVRRRRTRA